MPLVTCYNCRFSYDTTLYVGNDVCPKCGYPPLEKDDTHD